MTEYELVREQMTAIFGEIRKCAVLVDSSKKRLVSFKETLVEIEKQLAEAGLLFRTLVEGDIVSMAIFLTKREELEQLKSSVETIKINIQLEDAGIVEILGRRDALQHKYGELEKNLAKTIAPVITLRP